MCTPSQQRVAVSSPGRHGWPLDKHKVEVCGGGGGGQSAFDQVWGLQGFRSPTQDALSALPFQLTTGVAGGSLHTMRGLLTYGGRGSKESD